MSASMRSKWTHTVTRTIHCKRTGQTLLAGTRCALWFGERGGRVDLPLSPFGSILVDVEGGGPGGKWQVDSKDLALVETTDA